MLRKQKTLEVEKNAGGKRWKIAEAKKEKDREAGGLFLRIRFVLCIWEV